MRLRVRFTVCRTREVCIAVVPDPLDEESGIANWDPITTAPTAIPTTATAKAIARTRGDAKRFKVNRLKP